MANTDRDVLNVHLSRLYRADLPFSEESSWDLTTVVTRLIYEARITDKEASGVLFWREKYKLEQEPLARLDIRSELAVFLENLIKTLEENDQKKILPIKTSLQDLEND